MPCVMMASGMTIGHTHDGSVLRRVLWLLPAVIEILAELSCFYWPILITLLPSTSGAVSAYGSSIIESNESNRIQLLDTQSCYRTLALSSWDQRLFRCLLQL